MSSYTKQNSKQNPEFFQLFWPRVVMRKWLNINARDTDFSADAEDEEDNTGSDSDSEEIGQSQSTSQSRGESQPPSQFRVNKDEKPQLDGTSDAFPRPRRRKSETFRAQYINTKEIRICVGTWNVGGISPPDDLDIDDWTDINEPADIYVLGLQEIVPLNAGNIFGSEDSRPVSKWENIIRETLNRVRPAVAKIKSFSEPPSPSKFKPSEDIRYVEEEILLDSDSDIGEEVHPTDEEIDSFDEVKDESVTGMKMFDNYIGTSDLQIEDSQGTLEPAVLYNGRLTKMLSVSERIGLCWPEPPLNLLSQFVLERPSSFQSVKPFKMSKSFRTYNSFKSTINDESMEIALLAELDLEAIMKRKRRSSFVRIVSKQMVGVFLTIWVRRSLRRHIQNVKVSTVGVGVMGYIGNKGSISVSMSIYQTLFCFVCTHLTSGEKEGDELKRNADVHEIHRRTHFPTHSGIGLPKSIHAHERIIWLGDLNYRLNLSYDKTRELISKKDWSELVERDQLVRELRKGRAFDGWSEGSLNFPPTYKYVLNSDKYRGEGPKVGRRTPAWCDRILSYGKGLKLLNYRRIELKLSDHRPVTATYMAEVEVFSPKRLQLALTYTDAEIEHVEAVTDIAIDVGLSRYRLE